MAGQTGCTHCAQRKPRLRLFRLSRVGLLALVPLLSACSTRVWPVIAPGAPVALSERNLLLLVAGLTLIVVLPVFVLTFWILRRYRATDAEGAYKPHWTYSKPIDLAIWLIAAVVATAIAVTIWISTHRLDPYTRLTSSGPPLKVQAIAEDWKWLFIYPKQHIAAVNELVFPVGRPLSLRITSDTVMNSLYIPGLAGQIYAMAGMQTRLNAIANKPERFTGRNSQFSGQGFPDQHFLAKAVTARQFRQWVRKARHSPKTLDAAAYAALHKPSANVPVSFYSHVEPNLFHRVIARYKAETSPAEAARRRRQGAH